MRASAYTSWFISHLKRFNDHRREGQPVLAGGCRGADDMLTMRTEKIRMVSYRV